MPLPARKRATPAPSDRLVVMRIGGESPRYEILPPEAAPAGGHARPTEEGRAAGHSPFSKALKGLGRAVDAGEALMAGAAHGSLGSLDSGQLIALQAGIY